MGRRRIGWVGLFVAAVLAGAGVARADPSQEDVFRSIQSSVGHEDSISGRGMAITAAVVGGVVAVAVVMTVRQNRREMAGGGWGSASSGPAYKAGRGAATPASHSGKLVRELMKEAGLTRAQVRQLEAVNARLADDDRAVQHLATLLLCPSLITAARPEAIVQGA